MHWIDWKYGNLLLISLVVVVAVVSASASVQQEPAFFGADDACNYDGLSFGGESAFCGWNFVQRVEVMRQLGFFLSI